MTHNILEDMAHIILENMAHSIPELYGTYIIDLKYILVYRTPE